MSNGRRSYYQLQNQTQVTKHTFVGTTRIASKLSHYHDPVLAYNSAYEQQNVYTYHPDHLGSSNIVTDYVGNEFRHIVYTPYGETWIDEGIGRDQKIIGYRFTSKELDIETGVVSIFFVYL